MAVSSIDAELPVSLRHESTSLALSIASLGGERFFDCTFVLIRSYSCKKNDRSHCTGLHKNFSENHTLVHRNYSRTSHRTLIPWKLRAPASSEGSIHITVNAAWLPHILKSCL